MSERSMYQAVLGPAYAELAPAVQAFHRLRGRVELHGEVSIEPPRSPLARLIGRLLGSPRQAAQGPIRFELDAAPAAETWTRHFPGRTMRSHMRLVEGGTRERLGAADLRFTLHAADGALVMQLRAMRFLGVPCPRWLLPRIVAQETGDAQGRLHFHVAASVPGVGLVTRYRGWLDVAAARQMPAASSAARSPDRTAPSI
jgi:hypothetical protein